jgi:PTS system nitrogen regulatory IIA component
MTRALDVRVFSPHSAPAMQLSVRDAARLLDTTERAIYRWIAEGAIPCHRVQDQYRFNRAELLEWATAHGLRVSVEIFQSLDARDARGAGFADSLDRGGIHYDVPGEDRADVLRAVVALLPVPDGPGAVDRDFLYQVLLSREAQCSTGVGDGIALPHVRHPVVLHAPEPSITLCFLARAVDFGALDGKPVHTLFTIISDTTRTHLHLLSRLSASLHDPAFRALVARRAPASALLADARRVETSFPRPGGGPAA